MKIRILSILAILFFAPLFAAFGQEEEPIFVMGVSRSIGAGAMHDFGEVASTNQAEYEFKFKNTGQKEMIVLGVNALEGVGVTIPTLTVAPQEEGSIIVTVNPKYMLDRGSFERKITLKTQRKSDNNEPGVVIEKEFVFMIKGKVTK